MKKIELLILLFSFCVGLLNAQNDTTKVKDIFDMSLEELMELQVSGVSRYKQDISDVPNSIFVITQQQIKDNGFNDLGDALKTIVGFDITENAGQFGEFYTLRGISRNERFLILINGHKLNHASGTSISVGNSISIKYAQRIEIIFGPASAVYGADAFSGIINIVFNKQNDSKLDFQTNLQYGSLNTIDGSIEIASNINKNLSFYANARIYKSDGPDFSTWDTSKYNYNVVSQYPSPLSQSFEQPTNDHNIFVNLQYKNISVNYYRQQFDEGNALSFIPQIYIYNKQNRWKLSSDLAWVSYKKKFNHNNALNIDLTFKQYSMDNNSIYYKWTIPGVFKQDSTYKQYMTGWDKTIIALVTYNQQINDRFTYIIGVDNEFSNSIPPYANDEVLGKSDKYEGANAQIIDDKLIIVENRFSAFGQLTYSPFSIIQLVLGSRYDFSTRYGGIINPRAGLIISPLNRTKIKFIYGRAFQAPSLYSQYEQWGAPTIVQLSMTEIQKTNSNWNLQNQIVNSFEASITQQIGENINIKATGFYNNLTNLIERTLFSDSVYNKYFGNYAAGLRNENIGKQKIYGAEVSFNAKISKNVILYTFYTYTNAKSINLDNSLTSVPRVSEHKIWAGVTFQNLFNFVTISPRIKWVSDMYNSNTAIFANNIQPGYYNIDLFLTTKTIGKHFSIFANVTNLLDQKIEHAGLYEQSGVYTAVIPQNGIFINAGINVLVNKQ